MKTKPSKPKGRQAMDRDTASHEPEFPSARYFQIHFEHLEGLLLDTRQHLEALKQQVSDVCQSVGGKGGPEEG